MDTIRDEASSLYRMGFQFHETLSDTIHTHYLSVVVRSVALYHFLATPILYCSATRLHIKYTLDPMPMV